MALRDRIVRGRTKKKAAVAPDRPNEREETEQPEEDRKHAAAAAKPTPAASSQPDGPEPLYNVKDEVQACYDGVWYDAVVKRRESFEQDDGLTAYVYLVKYTVDNSTQADLHEDEIRARPKKEEQKNEDDDDHLFDEDSDDGDAETKDEDDDYRQQSEPSSEDESSEDDDKLFSRSSRRARARGSPNSSKRKTRTTKAKRRKSSTRSGRSSGRNHRDVADSDDSFIAADIESEESIVGEVESDESSEDADVEIQDSAVGRVDNDDFATADSSSEDENVAQTPQLEFQRKSAPKSSRAILDSDSSSEDDDNQGEYLPTRPSLSASPPKLPECTSELDTITFEPLPSRHVCFFPKCGDRQCFKLETLHKIALTTGAPQADGRRAFLQPPHFRSVMSDDLLDQIASRFGRQALNLNDDFYGRRSSPLESAAESRDQYQVSYSRLLENRDEFLGHFNRYIRNNMGSQDITVCPLCYIEAQRRLTESKRRKSNNNASSSSSEDDDTQETRYDPMLTLGVPDDEAYSIASFFCFHTIASVKKHISSDHNVDTKIVDGNGLYMRFKIRASDGLLQRYISANCPRSFQGSMQRYWLDGYNQDFIFLLDLMEKAQAYREIFDTMEEGDDASSVLEQAKEDMNEAVDYFESFQHRAHRMFNRIAEPFRKVTKKEIQDFIADDDVDDIQEGGHRAFDAEAVRQSMESEEQIVEHLRRRSSLSLPSSESDDDADDQILLEDDSEESARNPESSEPEDEWIQGIEKKRKARRASFGGAAERRRRSRGRIVTDEKPAPWSDRTLGVSSVLKKRRIIEESSDGD